MRETVSLCEHCYRHIPATTYEENGSIMMQKTCPEHGEFTYMIERDAEFYHSLNYRYDGFHIPNSIMLEVTDKCNLNCPHCYHEPENKTTDRSIDSIIQQIESWPSHHWNIVLAGAEPTVRKDLPQVINEINSWHWRNNKPNRGTVILTNGVKLNDIEYVRELKSVGVGGFMIGLNHHSYQGEKIHEKQLQGIRNCIQEGLNIFYVGYTLEDVNHFPEVIDEIQSIKDGVHHFRIRAGSDIGRSPDEPRWYLSDHVKCVEDHAKSQGYEFARIAGDDNIYHVMALINGVIHRLIQWSDPKTIDMKELVTPPWADFVPNKPITNFLHQVMLRDAAVNNSMMLHDTCPNDFWYKQIN